MSKSNLSAENTRGLITAKQTKPRPVASAAPHHHSSVGKTKEKSIKIFGHKTNNLKLKTNKNKKNTQEQTLANIIIPPPPPLKKTKKQFPPPPQRHSARRRWRCRKSRLKCGLYLAEGRGVTLVIV